MGTNKMVYITRLTADNVDDVISRINFSEPTIDPTYGNVSIRLYVLDPNGEKQNLVLETPWMKAPFGVSKYEANGSKIPKFSIPMSFDKVDKDYQRQIIYKDFLEKLDEKMIDTAF